jgi:ADP-ribose pyrophosphatase YjhB (NUDIX family)
MDLTEPIEKIEAAVPDPRQGLPQPVFRLVCRLTPMVNVDLLIRNERSETLLTWRDDGLYLGWHVPGGIVRFKERMADRIAAVARLELDTAVTVNGAPLAVNEIITDWAVRGHFISFLFDCALVDPPSEALHHTGGAPKHGQWAWHARCPDDIIASHRRYRSFIDPQP